MLGRLASSRKQRVGVREVPAIGAGRRHGLEVARIKRPQGMLMDQRRARVGVERVREQVHELTDRHRRR